MDDAENEKEQKAENYHHHNQIAKVLLIILAIFIFAGGCFFLGRISSRAKIGRIDFARDVAIERPTMPRMMDGQMGRKRFGEGITGTVSSISGDNLTIHIASSNKDYQVVIADITSIRKAGEIAAKNDLQSGQSVTVQGKSNSSGQITASLIIIN